MTRRLIIMRHAKSDWDSGAETDHDRPLNHRGRRDAPRIAERLVALGWVPDYVVSSDARRTQETLERMLPEINDEPAVRLCRELYHAGAAELVDELVPLPDDVETVLALGHNPDPHLDKTHLPTLPRLFCHCHNLPFLLVIV